MVGIVSDAPSGSTYTVAMARQMLAGDVAPTFEQRDALPDAGLALEAAVALGVTRSLTDSFVESWRAIAWGGASEDDVAAAYEGVVRD